MSSVVGIVSAAVWTATPASAAPSGTVTTFGKAIGSVSVATGSDGNVWFAGAGLVGKVTPAGAITTFAVPGLVPSATGSAIAAGPDGNLWVAETGAIWRITSAGVTTKFVDPAIGDASSITAGPDGNLWFTNFGVSGTIGRMTTAGVVTAFTGADVVLPMGIAPGADGNVWFTSYGNDGIGRITPSGVITVFKGSGISRPFLITGGPDGALWFTSALSSNIWRITTAGVVTTFPVAGVNSTWGITSGPDGALWVGASAPFLGDSPAPGAVVRVTTTGVATVYSGRDVRGPTTITSGADGNLWYANAINGTLGRITPSGTTSTFSASAFVGPGGVTAGPDDAVWFTNRDADAIGRLTVGGAVTTYTDAGISDPSAIAAGPDGNLWFTSHGNDRIGRITPAGAITTFTNANISAPTDLTAGADGNLWFTSTGNDRIGRITPAGVVATFTHASISGPTGIASGADGNLWFTNQAGGSIGRITPAGVVSSFASSGLSAPTAITRGPDGALWFTATRTDGGAIGRITTAGAITTFSEAAPGTSSTMRYSAITTGADGALWFTNISGPGVGRLTTAGAFSSVAVGGVRDLSRIASGPDGNIWVTAHRTSTVAQVATGVPGIPTAVQTTAGPGRVAVTWTAPANGGEPAVTGYTVTASPGGKTCTWTSGPRTCTISGLDSATSYTFRVTATNAVGTGGRSAPSAPVNPLSPTVPSTPAAPVAVAGDRSATVTWSPSADDGGRTLTGYTVTATPGGATCSRPSAPLTCTVTGLSAGTPYTFTVHATNAVGNSNESTASNQVTPVAGDLFHPLDAPTRILDSRPPPEQVGPYSTPWAAGTIRDVQVAGVGAVPANATAVTLNVTVTGTTAASFLTIWPKGDTQPTASNLNWSAGQTIPNAVTVKVGTGGLVQVFNPSGNATVIVDVVGYYDESGTGAGFTSQAPARVLDSRPAPETVGPYSTPWGAGTDRDVTVAGVAGVPADAEAVVLNATVTGTSAESFLTIYPNGASKPTASSLNWKAGVTIPNAVTVKVGAGGKIRVFNNSGNVNVIIDVVGYFKAGTGDAFHPVTPVRFADSRPAPETVGAFSTPWGAATTRSVSVLTGGAVPSGAKAILANFTVTSTSAESFATVWNTGAAKPTASSLNWKAGVTIANAVTAKVGDGDTISVFNNSGTVNVIADVGGWYG